MNMFYKSPNQTSNLFEFHSNGTVVAMPGECRESEQALSFDADRERVKGLDLHVAVGLSTDRVVIQLPPCAINHIEIRDASGQIVGRYHAFDNTYHPIERNQYHASDNTYHPVKGN